MVASDDLQGLLKRDSAFLPEVWAWFGIGVTVIILRFVVRIRMVGFRGFAGDDYVTIITLAMYTCDAAFVDICYENGTNVDVPPASIPGLTDAQRARLRYGSKMQLAAWYSYTALIWCMKATMLFFYKRLTFGLWQHRALKYLAWFIAVSYLAVVLTISLGCRPYHLNWQVKPLPPSQCTLKKQNFLVTAVLNVITDAAILCIPLPMLRQLKVPLFRKVMIALLLCSGLFVITAAIIRAAVTLGSSPSGTTINRWGVRETIIGILSINAPILRPLLTRNFWTGKNVSDSLAEATPAGNEQRHRKRVFGSKSSRSDNTGSSYTPKKLSKSDSAAFGVDTNVPGYSVTDGNNSSQEIIMQRDEEAGIELAPVSERHSEDAGGGLQVPENAVLQPLDNVVYVERSYAVRTSDAQHASMAVPQEQWREVSQRARTRTDISAVPSPDPR